MQRLFSMFPIGLPGIALFFLRISVIGMLFDATVQNASSGNISLWRVLALAGTSLLLVCGAFTPIVSAFSLVLLAINWPLWNELKSFEFSLQALVMVALLLLGPGAYSIDSKMFGRRVILPPE